MTATAQSIAIVGAGVVGLWQALLLARAGHRVRVIERSPEPQPFANAASRYAGAMLAPDTEAESAPTLVRELGRQSIPLWAEHVPITRAGSLVVAPPREPQELRRFARLTERHVSLDRTALATLEPELAEQFETALHYPDEAHLVPADGLAALLSAARTAGAETEFGTSAVIDDLAARFDWVIDCRGMAAAADIGGLRGVRGERLLVHARDVHFARPIRLIDPRMPVYVVPWPNQRFLIGATVIESEDDGPISVRSLVELLTGACRLHPGFAEAAVLETSAGLRPSLPDNVPRAFVDRQRRTVRVNGAYRHGFLLAPVLAVAVRDHLAGGAVTPLILPC